MDRELIFPRTALLDHLNENMRHLLALQTKSLGSGALREHRVSGNITVPTNSTVEIANTTCDPGDWLLVYGACVRFNLPGSPVRATQAITLSALLNGGQRGAIRYDAGDATEQILGVEWARFEAVTTLSLGFSWSRSDGVSANATCSHRQITMVPA